jgi:hypothetical protein
MFVYLSRRFSSLGGCPTNVDMDDLRRAVTSIRAQALDLLGEMQRFGFAADPALAEAVVAMQTVTNVLGTGERAVGRPPPVSQDAAIVLGLASTALPFATSVEDEAERWLRILRLHGQVGIALQALGVPEGPLETGAGERIPRPADQSERRTDPVTEVLSRSRELARRRGATTTGTLDILFALFFVYGSAFDRALYARGTSREELLASLADHEPAEPAIA